MFHVPQKGTHLLLMTQFNQPQSLSDLREQIENGTVPTPSVASILAFLDVVEKAIGPDFHDPEVLSSETSFSRCFPRQPDENLTEAFGDANLYGRCRESLHRHARLAGLWREDPYTLLNRLAKQGSAPGVNRKMMETHFPRLELHEITRGKALRVDRKLRGTDRFALRRSLATMDRFRTEPLVMKSGILGPEMIGQMPRYRDGDKLRIELPAKLAAVCARLPVSQAIRARRAFELAVDMHLLAEKPTADGWSLSEADAAHYHATILQRFSRQSAKYNLLALISVLRANDPAAVPDDVAIDRIRLLGRKPPKTKPVPKKKNRQPVSLPPELDAEVSDFVETRSPSRKRVKALRRLLRQLLDANCDIDSSTILKDAGLLLENQVPKYTELTVISYQSVFKAFLLHTNRLSPWSSLISRARAVNQGDIDLSGLLLIKKFAETSQPPLDPADIDMDMARDIIKRAHGCRKVSKCLQGLRSLDVMRETSPDLLPEPAIGDQRDWIRRDHGRMPKALEVALRSNAQEAGYSRLGAQALIVAVRKLYALTGDKSVFESDVTDIPWRDLIQRANAGHPIAMSSYLTELRRLTERLDRKWTAGWRSLQAHVVAAGIPRANNPVDTLMDVAGPTGLEPWQPDREWAWIHERALRPDLRRKWIRAIDCFDALHDLAGLAESGLLPAERLGPMPVTGSRLKNAHFPLPRRFEAALEGETKQVMEAAHFLWRCLRDLGICSRGDDPVPNALVSETHLDRILAEQSVMLPSSAQLHIARIRDWRESWLGFM